MSRLTAVAAAAVGLLLVGGCGGGGERVDRRRHDDRAAGCEPADHLPGRAQRAGRWATGSRPSREIAIAKRGVTPRLTRAQYLAAVKQARPPKVFLTDWKRGSLEGFLFPALYEFTQYTSGGELVSDQLAAFRKNFAQGQLAYSRSKNLTPSTSSRSPR